jgi:hypothetical protein
MGLSSHKENNMHKRCFFLLPAVLLLLAGCNSDSDYTPPGSDPGPTADTDGVWAGYIEIGDSDYDLFAIINDGDMVGLNFAGEFMLAGSLEVSGNEFEITAMRFYNFQTGERQVTAVAGGTAATRDEIEGQYAVANGGGGDFALFHNKALSDRTLTVDKLSANWSYTSGDYIAVLSVNDNLEVTGSGVDGCNVNGKLSLRDKELNAAAILLDFSGCDKHSGEYRGQLMMLDEDAEDDTILIFIRTSSRMLIHEFSRN